MGAQVTEMLQTDNAAHLINLGTAFLQCRLYAAAEAAYWQAIAADEDYSPPYRNLALLYQLQGEMDQGIMMYREYLARVPDDGEAHHNLGLLYLGQDQIVEAAAEFEIAAKLIAPDTPTAATNLGVGYFYRGELEIALMLYEHALELDPQFTPARYHAGIAFLYLGRLDEAISALESVVQAESDFPNAAINLGVTYNTAGRPAEATAIFEELLLRDPLNASAVLNLGYAVQEAGELDRAESCFRWCMESCPAESVYAQKAALMVEELARNNAY